MSPRRASQSTAGQRLPLGLLAPQPDEPGASGPSARSRRGTSRTSPRRRRCTRPTPRRPRRPPRRAAASGPPSGRRAAAATRNVARRSPRGSCAATSSPTSNASAEMHGPTNASMRRAPRPSHRAHRLAGDAGHRPAPPAVARPDDPRLGVGEQHERAVGRKDGQQQARHVGHEPVVRRHVPGGADDRHACLVDLPDGCHGREPFGRAEARADRPEGLIHWRERAGHEPGGEPRISVEARAENVRHRVRGLRWPRASRRRCPSRGRSIAESSPPPGRRASAARR